jgi:uncharacterized phage protein gp47/JayE
MSLQVPTTEELKNTIIAQFEASYGQTVPVFVKAFLRVVATVLAGMLIILYKYGGWIFLQQFVQYASYSTVTINGKPIVPLIEWGRLVGAADPTEATRAEMVVTVTVTNQTGSLPVNTQLINVNNGVTYLTIAAVPLTAATVQATIRAYQDQDDGGGKGTIGNLSVGDTVSFINPIPNVAADTTVASIVVTAADAETEAAYRERVSDRFRKQPQGGAYVDYELWGEEVEGIINVYPYTGDPGIVNVYSEATVASSGSSDGIPTQAQLDAVFAAIELDDGGLASRRPADSFVTSNAITRTAFDVEVIGISGGSESLATIQTKITETLTSYFLARAPFIHGLTLGKRRDRITKSAVAGAVQDVCDAFGAVFTGVVVSVSGGATVDTYSLGEGEKAKLGTAIYT